MIEACLLLALTARAVAEVPCPSATLPAYAHNDYENPRPLADALRLGYRGVEADIFLVEGELRVAHNRKHTKAGRTLQALYLDPLREVVARCGRVCTDSRPFLLNIEIKESSQAAYDTLCAVLGRYPEVLSSIDHGVNRPGAVETILVGWHPPLAEMEREPVRFASVQLRVQAPRIVADSSAVIRMVSLDYGKKVAWSGRARMPARGRAWLAALVGAKSAGAGRIARVYNVPPRPEIYRVLRVHSSPVSYCGDIFIAEHGHSGAALVLDDHAGAIDRIHYAGD